MTTTKAREARGTSSSFGGRLCSAEDGEHNNNWQHLLNEIILTILVRTGTGEDRE